MSRNLYEYAVTFVDEHVEPTEFADSFISRWKNERDATAFANDSAEINEFLSSVFCLADLYNPDSDREDYELDGSELRQQISQLLQQLKT